MGKVPQRKDTGIVYDRYFDGDEIQYTALREGDNPDAKPRRHGAAIDIRDADLS